MAPATLLFPLKIAALWLIGEGHPEQGILLIIVAKVLGTALVGRMFILLEPRQRPELSMVRASAALVAKNQGGGARRPARIAVLAAGAGSPAGPAPMSCGVTP